MTSTDPIADMLTRIRNAGMARHESLELPESKIKLRIAEILRDCGYLAAVERRTAVPQGRIYIRLRLDGPKSVIRGLRRVSKPGRRVYVGAKDIPKVKNGLGVCVLSTSKGVITGSEARSLGVGGEVLCEIW